MEGRLGYVPGEVAELGLVLGGEDAVHGGEHGLLPGELGVEPRGVARVLERRAEGRLHAQRKQLVPVDVAEERMRLDFLRVGGAIGI